MKSLRILFVALIALPLGGCLSFTTAQLENKLPRIDAQEVSVDVSTIYGVSGTLKETDVKWTGDKKRVGSSELRVTSPVGTYRRVIRDAATVTAAPATPK